MFRPISLWHPLRSALRTAAALALGAALFTSCVSRKDVAYVQNAPVGETQNYSFAEPVIQTGDILGINVNSRTPELSAPFNLPIVGYYTPRGVQESGISRLQGYTVESDGSITFPILGRIKAAGYTRLQLSRNIEDLLIKSNLLSQATVNTVFLNFKVSVLGEVNRPGSFTISEDRVTLFDALALAGDLTINARRDNVLVLREEDGRRTVYRQDLRSQDIFSSPCYYLRQNDVVMVEPNAYKIQSSGINTYTNITTWLSVLSTGTSMAAFIISLQRSSN